MDGQSCGHTDLPIRGAKGTFMCNSYPQRGASHKWERSYRGGHVVDVVNPRRRRRQELFGHDRARWARHTAPLPALRLTARITSQQMRCC